MDRNNKLQREFYINDMMEEIRKIVIQKNKNNDLSVEKNINDRLNSKQDIPMLPEK